MGELKKIPWSSLLIPDSGIVKPNPKTPGKIVDTKIYKGFLLKI